MSKALCFDLMHDALRAPVYLDCGPDVLRIQQCFYRARQYCRARSDYRFDRLKFHVLGPMLVIKESPVPKSGQPRPKLKVLRELRHHGFQIGTGLDGPNGEIAQAANSKESEE